MVDWSFCHLEAAVVWLLDVWLLDVRSDCRVMVVNCNQPSFL